MTKSEHPAGLLDDRICVALFAIVLGVHAWYSHAYWNNPPLEAHDFRQTQTAISIRYLAEDGLRLDYPTPVLGKPWSVPLEFPVYQLAAAFLVRHTGMTVEQAGRTVGLMFFYATLPALYLLAGRLQLRPPRRLLILTVILTCPLYLFYQRAILIETTALCFGIWFLWSFGESLDRPRSGYTLLAAALVALVALVKVTTLVAVLPAAGWLWLEKIRPRGDHLAPRWWLRPSLVAIIVVGLGVAVGFAWFAHTDSLKKLNPLSDLIQAAAQRRWGFGAPGLRFSADFWVAMYNVTFVGILRPIGAVLVLVFIAMAGPATRYRCIGLLLCFLGGPLVFANMYFVHDYYYFSNGFFLLAVLGLALDQILETPALPVFARWVIVLVGVAAGFVGYLGLFYPMLGNSGRTPELSRALKAITEPRDVLVIYGQDWNPVLPYTSGRRALMIPTSRQDDRAAQKKAWDNLHDEHVGAVVIMGDLRQRHELINDLVAQFHLSDKPVLTGSDTEVYVPASVASAVAPIMMTMGLTQYKTEGQGGLVVLADLPEETRSLFAMMNPRPREATTQFGLGLYVIAGRNAFGAHPVTQLVFATKPGARRIHAGFGMLADTYANPLKATDGASFSFVWRKHDGTMITLATRLLQPLQNENDRGDQEIIVPLPPDMSGDILAITGPGPNNSFAFDWAYWTFITIE